VARVFADITPLRVSAPYRRLWIGLSISNIGQQITAVAVGLQIYDITKSSLMVGLVGLAQVIPLVGFGLYGGTLSDAFDRRRVGVVTAIGLWACSVLFLAQSVLGLNSVGVLYLIIAVQSGLFAVGAPARQAIIPRLVSQDLLPAANALGTMSWNIGFTIGPLVAGGLVAATGTIAAPYLVDAIAFTVLVWSMWKLPSLPPTPDASGELTRAGWSAVRDGLAFIKGKRNLQMIFYEDLAAMLFGMPRALFPAIAALWYGGTTQQVALTLGLLSAGPAVGGVLSSLLSGPIGSVRFQGRAVVISIIVWGIAITAFGFTRTLVLALLFLAIAGAADNVSAILRNTMLQAAVPDEFRGRLQGVNTVVIAGGPRLGDVEAGVVASLGGEAFSVISGGIACTVIAVGLAAKFPGFWRYDAKHPVP
jgi:MFS family permease